MIGNRRIVVAVLALMLAAFLPAPPAMAAAGVAGVEECFQIYTQRIRDAEQSRDAGNPGWVEQWDSEWRDAGDDLISCVLSKLDQRPMGSFRFAHLVGVDRPHLVAYNFVHRDSPGMARLWLFTAPLEGTAGGIVPRVTVNGRIAWEGTEPTATGPLATEMPVLPGDNEIAVGCDPADPVAAVLVLELLEE